MKANVTLQYPRRLNRRLRFLPLSNGRNSAESDSAFLRDAFSDLFKSRQGHFRHGVYPRATNIRRIDKLDWHGYISHLMCVTLVERLIREYISVSSPTLIASMPDLPKELAMWACAYPESELNPKKGILLCGATASERYAVVRAATIAAKKVRHDFLNNQTDWMIPETSTIFSKENFILCSFSREKLSACISPSQLSELKRSYNILDLMLPS